MVIENVSIGDMHSPWLYLVIQRAKFVEFACEQALNSLEHNLLRRGSVGRDEERGDGHDPR